jgi:hypothetical protein
VSVGERGEVSEKRVRERTCTEHAVGAGCARAASSGVGVVPVAVVPSVTAPLGPDMRGSERGWAGGWVALMSQAKCGWCE